MENFEINILIDCVKDLRTIRERINNVNEDEFDSLTNAIEKIDEAVEFLEVGSPAG